MRYTLVAMVIRRESDVQYGDSTCRYCHTSTLGRHAAIVEDNEAPHGNGRLFTLHQYCFPCLLRDEELRKSLLDTPTLVTPS